VAMRPHGINRDTSLAQPLGLTEQEIDDLEAMMKALTADQFLHLIKETKKD
jgi:cytochrome c peroxidase